MEFNNNNYKKIYGTVIYPQMEYIVKKNKEVSFDENEAFQQIWEKYEDFRDHCKKEYMKPGTNRLDRHKVCSCLMLAILVSAPLHYKEADDRTKLFVYNEQLAITTGLSLMRAFIVNGKDAEGNMKAHSILSVEKKIFDDGFTFPEAFHSQQYRQSFAVELYFTRKEEKYNILSLSNTLFLLEQYNREHWKNAALSNSSPK